MCRIARARARAAGAAVRVLRADMRTFRLPAPVDLVLCEFASLNHVPARRDLARVARAVMRALRPGGLFLFDVNTPLSLKEQYAGTYWFEDPGFVMVLRAGHDARALRATLLFDWFLPRGGLWLRRRERLVNVAWTDAEIRSALTGAGFAGVRSWDGVDVRPPMPGARRGYDTYYLARRPAAR
jgi:SAM-dependent methyltransferase